MAQNVPMLIIILALFQIPLDLPDSILVLICCFAVVNICRRYPSVTELNLHGVINAETLVLEAIMFLRSSTPTFSHIGTFFCVTIVLIGRLSCRHLKTLTMGKGQLGEAFFVALAECPLLTALTVSDASLGSGIQEVTVNHDGLRELHILKCRALRISVR